MISCIFCIKNVHQLKNENQAYTTPTSAKSIISKTIKGVTTGGRTKYAENIKSLSNNKTPRSVTRTINRT